MRQTHLAALLELTLADIRKLVSKAEHTRLVTAAVATRRARLNADYRKALSMTPPHNRSALRREVVDYRRRFSLATELREILSMVHERDLQLKPVDIGMPGTHQRAPLGQSKRLDTLTTTVLREMCRLTGLSPEDDLIAPVVSAVARLIIDDDLSEKTVAMALANVIADNSHQLSPQRVFNHENIGMIGANMPATKVETSHALETGA